MSHQDPLSFDPALRELLLRATGDATGTVAESEGLEQRIPVMVRLHQAGVVVPELELISSFGTIVTGRIALGAIRRVRQHPAVASLKASHNFNVERVVTEPVTTPPSHTARPGGDGAGVYIGVIDWGFDVGHADLCDANGLSRIAWLWDQRGHSAAAPSPFGYGREISREAINRALGQPDPYQALGYDPAAIDPRGEGTHGTHVAAIAAGSGRAAGSPPGVAPAAELICVHLRGDDTGPADTLGDSVRVLEAVDYILRRAGERPVVINMSLGRTGDSKDGSSPLERALDAALAARPNRAICMSAGNYFSAALHARVRLRSGNTSELCWLLPRQRRTAAELELWYGRDDRLLVELVDGSGRLMLRLAPGASDQCRDSAGRLLASGYHRRHDPNNGDNLINLFVHPQAPSGQWRLQIQCQHSQRGEAHAYIERDHPHSQSRFAAADADPWTSLGTICCGRLTIATAAVDGRSGQIAEFSSAGPTRDLRAVPLLAAPGVAIVAARSSYIDAQGRRQRHGLVAKSGTSMAAPHVTGTVALMLQRATRPLWAYEIRQLLCATARPVRAGAADGVLRYGCGLLDTAAAVEAAASLTHLYQEAP
ncbi:MAG: S8 family serine peptidase [Gammaproteobacteria bacterium]|nr:S8 family serine peptidase [Gammaproteobacteria bacterium]